MHINSVLLFQKYAAKHFLPDIRVLEIGPESFPSALQSIVADHSTTWDTLDISPDPRLTYSAASEYTFPIPDNTYDLVVAANVIEHVRKLWIWIKEVARVCKVGGTVITINPVSWPYHEAPVDCWRAFPEGMKALYEDASLEVMLSVQESLEIVRSKRRIPGRSAECQPSRLRTAYRVLGVIGFPVECSYDTITIGKKVNKGS